MHRLRFPGGQRETVIRPPLSPIKADMEYAALWIARIGPLALIPMAWIICET